jgi:hypothetical protein
MFIADGKKCHHCMNLLFIYICVLFSYVLTCPLHMYVLTSWAYVPCMGIQCDCFLLYIFSGGVCASKCRIVFSSHSGLQLCFLHLVLFILKFLAWLDIRGTFSHRMFGLKSKLVLPLTGKGSCEHGNEPSGSINCWEVLE